MQIPILNGIYTDEVSDFRTSYPRNLIPVPKQQGISKGYLRPANGIAQAGTGPGVDRGGINWNGACYRVMGSKLVRIHTDNTYFELGDVGGSTTPVRFDYSFDRLGIASDLKLLYWDGVTLTEVTDPDLGPVIDMLWTDGYFMTTDGANLIVTELTDPTLVDPLKYGSSEEDPDPVVALVMLREEVYAVNRNTIQVFDNVGGDAFPFAPIKGATIPKGAVGTRAVVVFAEALAFVGSGRNEAPAVYAGLNSQTKKLSTREIDQQLLNYTELQLSRVLVEVQVDKNHENLLIHLPDQTLVYDGLASAAVEEPVWYTLTSSVVGLGQYRARNLVWCYDRWLCGDPTTSKYGYYTDEVSTHYGEVNGWDFGTLIVYNDGMGAVIHELELVALPGRVQFGLDPVIWTSYSADGETWSQERAVRAGKQGQRNQRIHWLGNGAMRNWRIQRFRGTTDAHLSMARLEARIEALNV